MYRYIDICNRYLLAYSKKMSVHIWKNELEWMKPLKYGAKYLSIWKYDLQVLKKNCKSFYEKNSIKLCKYKR